MRIVYATDGSEGARVALDFLASLPLGDHDAVRVVAVPVMRGFAVGIDGSVPLGSMVQTAFEATDDLALRSCQRFSALGVPAEPVVRAGLVTTLLLEEAARWKGDLIVVGSRGLGALTGVVLGSTARWLAQHSPVPVLVVRERRTAPTRVLVAADTLDDVRRARELIDALPLPRAETSVLLARSAGSILDEAGARGTDLIVIASDRMMLHDGVFAASTAGEVLARAHCAVLLAATPAMDRKGTRWQLTPN